MEFLSTRPFKDVVDIAEDGTQLLKVKLARMPPDRISVLCAKVGEDLRSALDQTAYAVAVASGAPKPDKIHFPFGQTADDFENSIRVNCKGIHPDIVTLFREFKAYKGGDDSLYALNELRKVSEHRMIKPVGQSIGNAIYYKNLTVRGGQVDTLAPVWNLETNEITIARASPGAKVTLNGTLRFFIALSDAGILTGSPAIETLQQLTIKVDGIVAATEAEARRISLIP
jgi:hypothetical protein